MNIQEMAEYLGLSLRIVDQIYIKRRGKLLFAGKEHEVWRWFARELSKGYLPSTADHWLPDVSVEGLS